MFRVIVLAFALAAAPGLGAPDPAAARHAGPRLERVVLVMRHGVRPPTQTNAELAKYADQPWPAWPVAPGELTPHGAETVRLMGESVRARYRAAGLLPASGCGLPGTVSVWADGADERTQRTGEVMAAALAPGCGVKAGWTDATPRDPIFGGPSTGECRVSPTAASESMKQAAAGPAGSMPIGGAVARLQAIYAPKACAGGAGTCFTAEAEKTAASGAMSGPFPQAAGLAEDILLEYADDKPMREVGWGRASLADIDSVMPIHERSFAIVRAATTLAADRGAPMVRVILGALRGEPVTGGPQSGPATKLLVLAGHDTNLVLMASVFGLDWTLPGEPDATAPSTALAFELWTDRGAEYVRPVVYYETLDQLRTLKPTRARALPLTFKDCASGPMGSCPLETLRQRALSVLPPCDDR
jgi:4-phytase/acid phosphatase